ncbi:hypothetical protein [Magnetospirillum molischianum]|uniref:Uncharacterized protein n=1 Tax=Magnetospirillum molischianum DSM 120 TaxID=1150626 RepID=H8FY94_MAGML|nr:hypothetical protein [Magnetospirillum molischianum]CCG43332.1 hypothetical protein PHAMO_80123 [Magnetospirillum molischianum DSM 120]
MSDETTAPSEPKKPLLDAEQLQKDLAFSDHDISAAMMRQASLFAHYAVIAAQAQKRYDTAKLAADIVESRVDKRLRDEYAQAGAKITEAALGKEILRDREYVEAQKKVNDARMIADLAKNALEAFKQRKDMLVQIGVALREEAKGELFLKGPAAREEAQRDVTRDRAARLVSENREAA